jgi:hypothetical protein
MMGAVSSAAHHADHDLGPEDFPDVDWSTAEPGRPNGELRVTHEVTLSVSDAQRELLVELARRRGVELVVLVQALLQEGLDRSEVTGGASATLGSEPTGARVRSG